MNSLICTGVCIMVASVILLCGTAFTYIPEFNGLVWFVVAVLVRNFYDCVDILSEMTADGAFWMFVSVSLSAARMLGIFLGIALVFASFVCFSLCSLWFSYGVGIYNLISHLAMLFMNSPAGAREVVLTWFLFVGSLWCAAHRIALFVSYLSLKFELRELSQDNITRRWSTGVFKDYVIRDGKLFMLITLHGEDICVDVPKHMYPTGVQFMAISSKKESAVSGSLELPAQGLPNGQFYLSANGALIGCCFLILFKGKYTLVTAAHVTEEMRVAPGRVVISNGVKHVELDRSWSLVGYSSEDHYDFAMIRVPQSFQTFFGVSPMTLAPVKSDSVKVCRVDKNGKFWSSRGAVQSLGLPFFFKHTASTQPGSSGAPIMCNGKVIGVHVRAGEVGENNIGMALGSLLHSLRSPATEKKTESPGLKTSWREDDEFEMPLQYAHAVVLDDQEFTIKAQGKQFSAEPIRKKKGKVAKGISWADEMDLDYEDEDFLSVVTFGNSFETCSDFRQGLATPQVAVYTVSKEVTQLSSEIDAVVQSVMCQKKPKVLTADALAKKEANKLKSQLEQQAAKERKEKKAAVAATLALETAARKQAKEERKRVQAHNELVNKARKLKAVQITNPLTAHIHAKLENTNGQPSPAMMTNESQATSLSSSSSAQASSGPSVAAQQNKSDLRSVSQKSVDLSGQISAQAESESPFGFTRVTTRRTSSPSPQRSNKPPYPTYQENFMQGNVNMLKRMDLEAKVCLVALVRDLKKHPRLALSMVRNNNLRPYEREAFGRALEYFVANQQDLEVEMAALITEFWSASQASDYLNRESFRSAASRTGASALPTTSSAFPSQWNVFEGLETRRKNLLVKPTRQQ